MRESIRTPLGRVRGLGAAKEGAHHFIVQRVSAIGLVFLAPWFLVSLISAVRGGHEGAVGFISQPLNAVLILLAVGASLYHMRVGMQVIIEDYIARPITKAALLILNTFITVALFAATAYAVLSLAT